MVAEAWGIARRICSRGFRRQRIRGSSRGAAARDEATIMVLGISKRTEPSEEKRKKIIETDNWTERVR